MGKLRDEAEALGIEVDGRWSNGTLERRIAEARSAKDEKRARSTKPESALAQVRLLKHYKPRGWYEVLGHYTAEEEFVAGKIAPPPFSGVEQAHKLWAGTVISIPAAEAKALVENVSVLNVTDRDPDTKRATGRRKISQRKPLAEVYTDWTAKLGNVEAAT